MIDLDIIFLNDLKDTLNYKDLRSVRSCLKRLGVPIYASNSKRPYCLKLQFERAVLEDKIKNLKERYGKDWLRVLQSEMQVYSNHKAIIEGKEIQKVTSIIPKESQPFGTRGARFLQDLHSK